MKNILTTAILLTALLSCQKESSIITTQVTAASTVINAQPQLSVSTNNIVLTQAIAGSTVITLQWPDFKGAGAEPDYRIEAALSGSQFNGWAEIGSSSQASADFTVEQFNRRIRQLIVTAFQQGIWLRVKYNRPGADPLYSYTADIQVTTYQPIIQYSDAQVFRIPGNYELWKISSSPMIVSAASNGEYEGYINFTEADAQFLMVKADRDWSTANTYYYIGSNKFGFGGSIFAVPSGKAGIYKFNASTNTNTWSCTKIDSWSINGTPMVFSTTCKNWQLTGNFDKGSFVFSANNANPIVFGHNAASEPGTLDYNGTPIQIQAPGNYTIFLSLLNPGNYSYSIQQNS